jgi:hypothetical protein
MARQVFIHFKALLMEPSALQYAERHDNIEAIYKKLQDRRDTADVTELLKELHRIVNEAIRAAAPGEDHAEGLTVDLSQIDFEKLRKEFAGKVRRKHAALQDIRDVVEKNVPGPLGASFTSYRGLKLLGSEGRFGCRLAGGRSSYQGRKGARSLDFWIRTFCVPPCLCPQIETLFWAWLSTPFCYEWRSD